MNAPNFIKLVTTLFIAAGIGGCATAEQKPLTDFIPVVAPKPPLPARPHLAIEDLARESTPAAIHLAYATSLAQCQGYAEQLEAILQK